MEKTNISVVLFDLNSYFWMGYDYLYEKQKELCRKENTPFDLLHIEGIIDLTLVSVFSHASQSSTNKVAIYRFDEAEVEKVFPLDEMDEVLIEMLDFLKVRKLVKSRILDYLVNKAFSEKQFSRVIEAIGKGLCFINKQKSHRERFLQNLDFSGKILIIFNSKIPKAKFQELMSCVFVCQSRNFVIDALVLNDKKQDFLLQAITKTKGLYFHCKKPNVGAMQYFLQGFNIAIDKRRQFKMPQMTDIPSNSSCDCHKETVDLAWICSNCLAIYCSKGKDSCPGKCSFCGVRFDLIDFNTKLNSIS